MTLSLKDKIAAKRQVMNDKDAGRVRSVKFPNGKTVIRLLPGTDDPNDFFQEIGIHWIKNKASETVCAVGDRQICFQEPCPVRDAIGELIRAGQAAGDDALVKRAKDMMAKSRYFVNGVVMLTGSSELKKGEAVLFEFSENTFGKLLSIMEDYIEADHDVLDLEKGVAFVIERSGSGLDTEYAVSAAPKNFGVIPSSVLDKRTDLLAYKRAQFDDRAAKAIAAISKELGRPLDSDTIARLTAPVGKAIAGPTSAPTEAKAGTASKAAAKEPVVEAEFEETPASPASAVDDVDAIMAELDNL